MASSSELDRAARDLDARLTRARRMPFIGDGQHTNGVNLVVSYAELVAVSLARAKFLGELLAEQYAAAQDRVADARATNEANGRAAQSGLDSDDVVSGYRDATAGLIGVTGEVVTLYSGKEQTAEFIATGEDVRALVELEGRERDRAARLIEQAHKMGVELDQVEVLRTYAGAIASALEAVVAELGLDVRSEPVLRSARRAGMVARQQVGRGDGDPDMIGARISARERVAVLEAALVSARREVEEAERATRSIGQPGG